MFVGQGAWAFGVADNDCEYAEDSRIVLKYSDTKEKLEADDDSICTPLDLLMLGIQVKIGLAGFE